MSASCLISGLVYFIWRLADALVVWAPEAGFCKLVWLVYTEDLYSVDVDTESSPFDDGKDIKMIQEPKCIRGQIDCTANDAWLWPNLEDVNSRLEIFRSELDQGHGRSKASDTSAKYKDPIALGRHS